MSTVVSVLSKNGHTQPLTDAEIGRRIREARSRAGFATEAAFGRTIGLNQSVISRIESGKRSVSATELALIADVVKRPAQHFLETSPQGRPLFRLDPEQEPTQAAEPYVRWLEQFAYRVKALREFTTELDSQLPKPVVIHFESPSTFEEADRAAETVRAQLGIGFGPAPDMFELLERVGCLVVVREMQKDGPDAIYVPQPLGIVVLNGNRPRVRQRFTLAHELAHHLFHSAHVFVDDNLFIQKRRPEQLANRFAASFLMPFAAIDRELVQRFGVRRPESAEHLYWLSFHLNVSLEALSWQVVNLGLASRSATEEWQREDRSALAFSLGLSGEHQKPPVKRRWPPEFLQRLRFGFNRGLLEKRELASHLDGDKEAIGALAHN